MEGVSHNIVMSVEEAERFEVFTSVQWEIGLLACFSPDKILDTIAALIGKATEETLATFNRVSLRNQVRYPKAVTVAGWAGIGKERLVKYTTKTLMTAKLFDTLIWMMGQEKNLSLKNFQRLIAEGLKIPVGRHDDNDDDSDDVDTIVSEKISLILQDRNFLLVHNGRWGQEDLRIMGIPSIKGLNRSMILVASKNPRENHEHFSLTDYYGDQWMTMYGLKFIEAECQDIVSSPEMRKAGINITPMAVKDCLIYFVHLTQYMKVDIDVQLQAMRYWFAEGFIGDATLDLETIFKQGNIIFEELRDRDLIRFVSGYANNTNFSRVFPCRLLHIGYEKLDNPKTNGETDGHSFFAINSNPTPEVSELTTIILCPLSSVESYKPFLPKNFLEKTRCVRVLSFMSTTLSKLPSSVLHLANNLRFLNLRNCKNLVQVPYLSALVELQMLDLSNTSLEEFPQDSFENLQCLRLLDLTGCVKLSHLPSSISCLLKLERLLLGGCRSLRSLPKSISNLVSLKQLNLESCSALRILSLTSHHLPESLEELNLSNSSCLQGISSISSSTADMIPNLQVLNISGIQLEWISFKNYSSLENLILQSNTDLQFLDLSGTKITKFPLEGKPHLSGLKRLDLLGVKHIHSVHWNDIDWLPHEVNWDECGDNNIQHMQIPLSKWRTEGSGGVFLSLTSANILQTLSPSSQLWETCLSRFLVYICPCADRGKGKAAHPQKLLSHYKNIEARRYTCAPCHERCLEIEGGNMFRGGIAVLSHTNFLYLHDSTLELFSNLGLKNMNALTECRIERCHEIKVIFDVPSVEINQPLLTCLEKLQISNLMKLAYVCAGERTLNKGSFSSLKHLQLEYCAQLVKTFSSGVFLENLEVLDIKFCARLEEIFSGEHEQGSLPRLHTLFLLELPSLKHIVHDVSLLALKKAQIKGCPKLRTLPISSSQGRGMVDTSIEIKGECEWWEQLEWKDSNMKGQICFIPWKPFKYPRENWCAEITGVLPAGKDRNQDSDMTWLTKPFLAGASWAQLVKPLGDDTRGLGFESRQHYRVTDLIKNRFTTTFFSANEPVAQW
ncbi:hypothetical protein AQUCO_03900043v1 [Aquilegia coerulea]|uniref:Uncharacterized protein n=1 Tax=Aquilegia coerulea TaxID=218851 RepID=A0A2G5CRM6_AQUCA|nr:hypothetical protein AQUCO_03900043v1 [Aquilegia coerulea]